MNPQLYTFFLSVGLLHTTIIKGTILHVLRDLMPFIQFKKHEKYPWRVVNFSKVAGFIDIKSNTLLWMFFTFCKLCKWYQIVQNVSCISTFFSTLKQNCQKMQTSKLGWQAGLLANCTLVGLLLIFSPSLFTKTCKT